MENILEFFGSFLEKHLTFRQNREKGMTLTTHDWSVFLLKPSFIPHSDYQAFVLQHLRTSYGPGIVLINKDWPLAVKL